MRFSKNLVWMEGFFALLATLGALYFLLFLRGVGPFDETAQQMVWKRLVLVPMMLVPFLLAWWILSVTFLKTVTTHHAAAKVQYREKREKAGSADGALYRRELSRLLGSAPYIRANGK